MAREQKYGQVTTEHGTIPDDEPVFILRAQDALAVSTIQAYYALCSAAKAPNEHLLGVSEAHTTFLAWQRDHPVKTPD